MMIGSLISRGFFVKLVCLLLSTFAYDDLKFDDKFTGQSFGNFTMLTGRRVTCNMAVVRKAPLYVSETWACEDMRIDGMRLRYGYMPELRFQGCGDGNDDKVLNDIAAMCRHLLQKHGVEAPLWAAMAADVSCDHTISEARLVYHNNASKVSWRMFPPGRGYVKSLLCTLLPT